jgi:hypothetical protein
MDGYTKQITIYSRVDRNNVIDFSFTGRMKYPPINMANMELTPDEWPLKSEISIPHEAKLPSFGCDPKLTYMGQEYTAKHVYSIASAGDDAFVMLSDGLSPVTQ